MRHNFWYKEVLKNKFEGTGIISQRHKVHRGTRGIFKGKRKILSLLPLFPISVNSVSLCEDLPPCLPSTPCLKSVFSRHTALKINLHHFTRREK